MPDVLLEVAENGVAVITLNRPEARNAMSANLSRELRECVAECEARDDVRCMVLTGAGKCVDRPAPLPRRSRPSRATRLGRKVPPSSPLSVAAFTTLTPPTTPCSPRLPGGRAFCAGIDLKEFASQKKGGVDPRASRDAPFDPAKVSRGILGVERTKMLIGAVNGPSVTGGLELALDCDFLIASTEASFADTHARVGVMPGGGLTVRLPQFIGL